MSTSQYPSSVGSGAAVKLPPPPPPSHNASKPAPASTTSSSSVNRPPAPPNNYSHSATNEKPFWNFTAGEVSAWINSLAPGVPNTGGMLFPKSGGDSTTPEEEAAASAQRVAGRTLVGNLIRSLTSASSSSGGGGGGNSGNKRPRIEQPSAVPSAVTSSGANGAAGGGGDSDAYGILDPTFSKSAGSTSTTLSPGAILSRMTLGGLVNGLAGRAGGVVDTLTCIPLGVANDNIITSGDNGNGVNGRARHSQDDAAKKEETKRRMEGTVPTAADLRLRDVVRLARGLHRSVAAR